MELLIAVQYLAESQRHRLRQASSANSVDQSLHTADLCPFRPVRRSPNPSGQSGQKQNVSTFDWVNDSGARSALFEVIDILSQPIWKRVMLHPHNWISGANPCFCRAPRRDTYSCGNV